MSRIKRIIERDIPPLHMAMILSSLIILLVCIIALPFYPKDLQMFLVGMATTSSGFLFGKFTNGFKHSPPDDQSDQQEQSTAK